MKLKKEKASTKQHIVYVDMDDTLCDFTSAYKQVKEARPDTKYPQSLPGFYMNLEPIEEAIETYQWLNGQPCFEVFILTAPSILNPQCYTEKRLWVENWLGMSMVENLIITSRKDLNKGDFLIDDKARGKGQDQFEGKFIQYGSTAYPSWVEIKAYFEKFV